MTGLPPITKVCEPRSDVLGGQLSDLHFAANLDKIVRDPRSYPVYGLPFDLRPSPGEYKGWP